MLTFIPFRPEHMREIQLQDAHAYLQREVAAFDCEGIAIQGLSWTGLRGNAVVGAAGLLPIFGPRAMAWANLGRILPTEWSSVHRLVRRIFARATLDRGIRRIEAFVDPDFAAAVRWVEMLGFVDETPNGMRLWDVDGRTMHLYARIS